MPFVKGQSGNPLGGRMHKDFTNRPQSLCNLQDAEPNRVEYDDYSAFFGNEISPNVTNGYQNEQPEQESDHSQDYTSDSEADSQAQ